MSTDLCLCDVKFDILEEINKSMKHRVLSQKAAEHRNIFSFLYNNIRDNVFLLIGAQST